MRVLVTGGAGFIGSHIVDACVAAGHEVAVADDLSTGSRASVHPEARFYRVDIRDPKLERVLAEVRPEVVCHQAAKASVRDSMEDPCLYADVNVVGSVRLLECCRKHGVRKVLYASTSAVYGEPRQLPIPEGHPINPLDPYGASKHHVEHYLHLYRIHYNLDYTVLRYGNVFGPRQDPYGEAGVVAIFARQMLTGQQPVINGDGRQQRDFVYVSDVVAANLLAFNKGGGGVYNIGTGRGTSVNEIFDLLAGLTGLRVEKVHGPPKRGEVSRVYFRTGAAASELGWSPKYSLAEGLSSTVCYLRDQLTVARHA